MNDQSENSAHSVKCQYITLDAMGNVTDSCDTLFEMDSHTRVELFRKFPFLILIFSRLERTGKEDEPVFIPDVDFTCDEYHSVCDFTFMRTVDARGVKRIVWMIYDNSEHYKDVIRPGKQILKKTAGILNLTLL
jgi:hypothetical protein